MQNFANQCLDMARSILGHNLDAINEDGTVVPFNGEVSLNEEGAHAFAAIGEFYRATRETKIGDFDIVDLGARCLSRQVVNDDDNGRAWAYNSLGLLAFGPAKERNLVWERLVDEIRTLLDKRLLERTGLNGESQAFNIAKAVARYSMGLTKKDETGKLIDKFLEQIDASSSTGYFSDETGNGIGGVYDLTGLMSFIFIRQALKLHVNFSVCERKLPSIRTYAEKYFKLLPDLVRSDGLGFAYGRGIGVYGQIYCISMILQFMRDGWVSADKKNTYLDILRRLFQFFFVTYLDQEHGCLVVNDDERTAVSHHTTRIASFDAARYLCQWSRLAKSIGLSLNVPSFMNKTGGRFVAFDKSAKKEQGLFTYQDASTGLHIQLPLISGRGNANESDALAFPHCPGIFDCPANKYLPVLVPELTFDDGSITVPCFYGKRCTTTLGMRNTYNFSYEQPDLITTGEVIKPNIGSCNVAWSFEKSVITCEFAYKFTQQITLNSLKFVVPLSAPHSTYRLEQSFTVGDDTIQITVLKDDFHAEWSNVVDVTNNSDYKTYYGKICYLQILERSKPLILSPNKQYKLQIKLEPDVQLIAG